MRSLAASLLGVILAFGPMGCGPTGADDDDDVTGDGGQKDVSTGPCVDGTKQCEWGSNALQLCQGGKWVTSVTCPLACDVTLGCVECVPGSTTCDGNNVVGCTADGRKGGVVAQCQSACSSGTCSDPCGQAEVNKSYLGCDYYPTVTMNSELDPSLGFSFAVAVAAPSSNSGDAQITITGGGMTTPVTDTVAPGALKTIKLPWVMALKQEAAAMPPQVEKSVAIGDGAYHLVSTNPVTVYQFNALEYQVGQEFSYTNDASLLLPRHTWSDSAGKSSYIVMSRPTMELGTALNKGWSPGFFAVVASQDSTTVEIKFTANTIAGQSNNPKAYTPGATDTFYLQKGTVMLFASGHNDSCTGTSDGTYTYCDLAEGYDLTGTEITADKPIGVFGGHNCDFIPYNKWACDHLEEQLFPLTAWGKRYVGARAVSTTDPNLWRVLSGDAANVIQFNPPINDKITNTTIGQVTLDKGKYVEFITDQDFEAQADTVFMMAGYMVGQNYSNPNPGQGTPGDPAMSLAVPVEQFRKSYTFHAPESYQQNYLTIIAKPGTTVTLDGNAITDFTPVGSGDWGINKLTIQGGTHTIATDGNDGFGIMVYGVGSYTSYMYPGGLDVKEIYVPG